MRASGVLTDFISLYKRASDWQTPVLDQISHKLAEEKGYLVKEAFMTLRVALTGQKATPPLFDILSLIGREKTLERLQSSQKLIQK